MGTDIADRRCPWSRGLQDPRWEWPLGPPGLSAGGWRGPGKEVKDAELAFFFFLFGSHPQHMEVQRLGVKSEL